MTERKMYIKELAEIVFGGKALMMKYLRDSISKLTDEEMLEFVKEIDSIFQQYAENV